MAAFEAATAVALTLRFWIAYDDNLATALWHGIFHAVSAFNNAGFALYSDSLIGFAEDPWIIIPVCGAVIAGGLGFPVLIALFKDGLRHKTWTVHTRLTVYGTLLLLAVGTAAFAAFDWARAETLGHLSLRGKFLASLAGGVFPRTAGGIKITTFLVLGFAIWNEIRGREQVTIAHRSISSSVQRQALSVALLGVGAVIVGTILMLMFTDHGLERVLFETISAFATIGVSTGITFSLPASAQGVLIALMFIGRIGTITVASALALSAHPRFYRLPEERPIIG
ncbi:potassium transporter TrkG [Specibacter sp. RAF43]|uniref:potassium transporter TrkG n=1 Tax=Specibacter sp. RAF43 TaxID=3233057 RepID=UPI003F988174